MHLLSKEWVHRLIACVLERGQKVFADAVKRCDQVPAGVTVQRLRVPRCAHPVHDVREAAHLRNRTRIASRRNCTEHDMRGARSHEPYLDVGRSRWLKIHSLHPCSHLSVATEHSPRAWIEPGMIDGPNDTGRCTYGEAERSSVYASRERRVSFFMPHQRTGDRRRVSNRRTQVDGGQHVAHRVGCRDEAARHLDAAHGRHGDAVAGDQVTQPLVELEQALRLRRYRWGELTDLGG